MISPIGNDRGRHGFTLIEALVTAVVLMAGIAAVLGAQAWTLAALARVEAEWMAESLGRRQLGEWDVLRLEGVDGPQGGVGVAAAEPYGMARWRVEVGEWTGRNGEPLREATLRVGRAGETEFVLPLVTRLRSPSS